MRKALHYGITSVLWITIAATPLFAQTTITVNAGGSLQAALNSAQPGDTILVEAGATFTGNFTLPLKSGTSYITVRSSAPDASLPGAAERMTPSYAASLPKIKSANTTSAIVTATGAHHWKLLFLEVQANSNGYGDIIRLGSETATTAANQPSDIIIDRCYIHGDRLFGQKNGIVLHSRSTEITNSYIADIKGIGQETHAISGYNGPGPYTVTNNYIEAAGINFFQGGSDPAIVDNVPGMALAANGYGITVARNHIRKDPAWINAIVATPTGVTATNAASGGTLTAGTYGYRVAALVPSYQGISAISAAASEVVTTIASGTTGSVQVQWMAVTDATKYRVYGRLPGAPVVYFDVTSATVCSGTSCTFIDTGAAGKSGGVASATRWLVKNLFELKIGQDVLVDGNTLEYNWVGTADQPGYAVLLRSNPTTDTGAPWTVVQRVLFSNNIVRHVPGGVNMVGLDGPPNSLRIRANHLTIRNNLFDDITPATWGGGNPRFASVIGADDVTIDHNTVILNGPGVLNASSGSVSQRFVYTNNMSARGTYGVKGDSQIEGTASLNAYFPGWTFRRNVVAGAAASLYPTDNYYPTASKWQTDFVDFAAGNYGLNSWSAYVKAGTDGLDLGADLGAIAAAAGGGTSALSITTTSLAAGTVNVPYSAALAASGGTPPYDWVLAGGSLPAGLALDPATGVVSGTPGAAGTSTFTVEVQDSAVPAVVADAALTLTISAPVVDIVTASLPDGITGTPYSAQLQATGGTGSFVWTVTAGSLPAGLVLDSVSGVLSGNPSASGSYTFTVQAQDTAGTSDSQAFSMTITSPAPAPNTIVPGGSPVTVTISTANQNAQLTFSGVAGQRVALQMTGVSITTSYVSISKPDGTSLVVPTFVGTGGGFIDTITLPTTGTYTILIDPSGTYVGSMTLTLYDVPADLSGTIIANGSAQALTITTPGQNGRRTFAGTAGQRISLQMTAVTIQTAYVSITKPDGTTLVARTYVGTGGGFIDVVTLPVTGTYTILVDPSGASAGGITLTLYDVPADLAGSISADGSPQTITTTTPGQNARRTFSGTAGQRVSLQMTAVTIPVVYVSITKPDGTTLVAPKYVGTSGGFIDVVSLPTTGVYTILVDPSGANTGNVTLKLYTVPADTTGSLTAGGPSVTVTLTTPGQNGRLTFSGTAGQRVTLQMSVVTLQTTYVSILKPDGTTLVAPTYVGSSGGSISAVTLPVAGTYTIVVDPSGTGTGSMTLTLLNQ